MKFTIIGSGNMGWFMAGRLSGANHEIAGIYSRNTAGAKELAEACKCEVFNTLKGIPDIYEGCILAVPDRAISDIAEQLSFEKTTLMHTAGSVAIDTLSSGAENYGVVWPVYSITRDSLLKNADIPCAYEANNDKALEVVEAVANCLRLPFAANAEQRKVLHLCAVLSNNFNNHLLSMAEQLCNENDISFTQLVPIIKQTADRIISNSPKEVQTGPAIRGDEKTMQMHLDILSKHPHWQIIYTVISNSIAEMYRK
jgi:predicted short-subunit dehydrogenase-like oxidoreductase (DUF2520 family)